MHNYCKLLIIKRCAIEQNSNNCNDKSLLGYLLIVGYFSIQKYHRTAIITAFVPVIVSVDIFAEILHARFCRCVRTTRTWRGRNRQWYGCEPVASSGKAPEKSVVTNLCITLLYYLCIAVIFYGDVYDDLGVWHTIIIIIIII